MATSYPSGLDNFSNPTSTSKLGDSGVVHHEQHANSNDAIEAIQTKLGADNSSVVTSIDYRVRYLENNPTLPSQNGNVGKYLTTDGSVASWATVSGGGTSISSTDQLTEGTNNLYFTNERAQDAIDTLFANGNHNGITVTYNDQNNSISLASTASVSAATPTSLGTVYGKSTTGDLLALGYEAGLNLTSATSYTLIGYKAGYSNTTGGGNHAFGRYALYSATTGSNNLAVGSGALYSLVSSNQNTAIGHSAGANSTGLNNTFLGHVSGNGLTSGSGNVILGYNAQPSSASVSYEITIGDTLINRFRIPGLGIDWTPSAYARATYASTSAPSGGNDGDVWLTYTA